MEIVKNEHKKQLHDRISERRVELERMLVELNTDARNAKSERARAVEEALAALTTHLAGGWDSIDESESAALSRWLDTSRFLFDAATPAIVAAPVAAPEPIAVAVAVDVAVAVAAPVPVAVADDKQVQS